jgi:hypothetical protein
MLLLNDTKQKKFPGAQTPIALSKDPNDSPFVPNPAVDPHTEAPADKDQTGHEGA